MSARWPVSNTGAREHPCALDAFQRNSARSILVVAAHPDDETIGVGATLGSLVAGGSRVELLHVTDGAPRDVVLRPTLCDRSPAEAARVRWAELVVALRAGGLDPDVVLSTPLGVADQEAALAMAEIARSVARRLERVSVDLVITHPYEGGHPDHDAVALAVHVAAWLHARTTGRAPPLVGEMSSYHGVHGLLTTATFLASAEAACGLRHQGLLDDAARARKRAMLDAFATQSEVLRPFDTAAEPLRCAPAYDFTRAPHPGTLHYERLPFGWTGARWRDLAREALRELGVELAHGSAGRPRPTRAYSSGR